MARANRSPAPAWLLLLALGCGEPASPSTESTGGGEIVPITDGAEFLAELESRLRRARTVTIQTTITSRGLHTARFEGTATMSGDDVSWQLVGTFGGEDAIEVGLHADANHTSGGAGPRRFDQATPPELRDALVTGLVRMGLLHDCVRLIGGDAPDLRSTSTSDWVVLEDVTVGDATLIESEFAVPIHVHLRVAGEPMGEATLWIDEARGLPVRRDQIVTFPEGEMHVSERYTSFDVID